MIDVNGGVWLRKIRGADVAALEQLVKPNERVVLVTRAHLVQGGLTTFWTRLLVVTSSRMLCIGRGLATVIDVPHPSIKSVEVASAIGSGILVIRTGQGEVRFNMPKGEARQVEQAIDTMRHSHSAFSPRTDLHGEVDGSDTGLNEMERLRRTVELLETDMARLQEQVDFLEQLMRQKGVSEASPRLAETYAQDRASIHNT